MNKLSKKLIKILFLLFPNTIFISCQQVVNYSEIEIKREKKASDPIVEVEKGDIFNLNASIEFSNGELTTDVIWESLTPNIVKIEDDGKIKALEVGEGQLKITAKKDSSKTSYIKVKVSPLKEIVTKITDGSEKLNELFGDKLKELNSTNNQIKASPSPSQSSQPLINYVPVVLEGDVYDSMGNTVTDAEVLVRSLDKTQTFKDKKFITVDGMYRFKDIPFESLVEIIVSKEGWTTRKKVEVMKSKDVNIIDFGNLGEANYYSIQNSPEIVNILLNNKKVSYVYKEDFNLDEEPNENDIFINKITSSSNRFNFNFLFSESVDKESLEDSIEVLCNGGVKLYKGVNLTFNWSTDFKSVSFSGYLDPSKGKYSCKMQFRNPFKDNEGNEAINNRFINFAPNISGDYVYFSN